MPSPHRTRTSRGLAAAVLISMLGLAACSSDSDSDSPGAASPPTAAPATTAPPTTPAAPFGPACAGLPSSGPGSLSAVADEPVATAAAQSPALSTLVTAVTKAGLVDTLNGAQNITVFAPTNDAFAKIPKATLNQVLADQQALTNILKYHVVGQRSGPAELDAGTLTTLQGGTIRTAKAGDTYTANDARVLCGDIQTRNATVHLIDTVLMPTS
ncbi:MAG TPA: fasciclin domain-containing protein [Pilimelia sp.]|nr:fasciclin domain-containing protein [Pilimelia sp.]